MAKTKSNNPYSRSLASFLGLLVINLCSWSVRGDDLDGVDLTKGASFIFGDSLVDAGNNNYLPTLSRANIRPNGIDFKASGGTPTGRYTNGRTIGDIVGMLLRILIPFWNSIFGQDFHLRNHLCLLILLFSRRRIGTAQLCYPISGAKYHRKSHPLWSQLCLWGRRGSQCYWKNICMNSHQKTSFLSSKSVFFFLIYHPPRSLVSCSSRRYSGFKAR